MTFGGNLSQIDLRLLHVFRAVADAKGYTGAELTLGRSKPSISMDIPVLETQLGLTLCRRGRSGFALTDEGVGVLEATNELLANLDLFRARMAGISYDAYGGLSIELDDSLLYSGAPAMARFVAAFSKKFPKVPLTLTSGPTTLTMHAVVDGRADLAVSTIPKPISELRMEPVLHETLHVYHGRLHPLARLDPGTIDETLVRSYDFVDVVVRQSAQTREFMESVAVSSSANMTTRLLFILSGAFVGFLPEPFAA
ncbi:MAG: LysR family transcriptional regulator [Alteraurantiacibacter sp.]